MGVIFNNRKWWLGFLVVTVMGDSLSFSKMGCYKKSAISDLLTLKDSYMYQTSLHCEDQCSDKAVAALYKGFCYCGSTIPNDDDQVDDSNCDIPCYGYKYEACGGDNYFMVYSNAAVDASTADSSATATSTSSTSSSSNTSSSSSSSKSSTKNSSSNSQALSTSAESTEEYEFSTSDDSSTSSFSSGDTDSSTLQYSTSSDSLVALSTIDSSYSDSSTQSHITSSSTGNSAKATTLVSTITNSPTKDNESIVEVTETISSGSPSSLSSPSSSTGIIAQNEEKSLSSSRSLSSGGIAGVVVGVVAGVGIIAGVVFLFLHRKRNRDDPDDGAHLDITEKNDGFDSTHPYKGSLGTSDGDRYMGDSLNNYIVPDPRHESAYYPEYGRRRLSDGSLPDMVERKPSGLKVINA